MNVFLHYIKQGLFRNGPLLIFGYALLLSSCHKFLDIPAPPDKMDKTTTFATEATATAAIAGIYSELINSGQQFSSGVTTLYAGLAADELLNYAPHDLDEFVANAITEQTHGYLNNNVWLPAYKAIYSANLAIEQLSESAGLAPAVKARLLGEVRFCRAFSYFYLVSLFGEVPLVFQSDYRENRQLPRASYHDLYTQMISDLVAAKEALPPTYPTANRGRPNKWTATALLARVYLYQQKWAEAEREASEVIASGLYNLSPIANTFLKNSNETLWQLIPGNELIGSWEAYYILPPTPSAAPTYLLTSRLVNAFEAGDQRLKNWVGSRSYSGQTIYYPAKYKFYPAGATPTEAYIVLRLAEQYLIRAEARAHQDKIPEGVADLDLVRKRANLSPSVAADKSALLDAVAAERRVELFAEWGHRWLDTKRTKTSGLAYGYKPGWQATDTLWPLPVMQLNANPALRQNPGY